MDQLERVFEISADGVNVIDVPGTKARQKAIDTYVLVGVSRFLAAGETNFSDDIARERCTHFGCYDHTNHSKAMRQAGNLLTGSKSGGWRVTAPGLKHGAEIIKQLTKEG
jgi:hypothetical protein